MINWAAIYVRSEYQNNHQPEPDKSLGNNEQLLSQERLVCKIVGVFLALTLDFFQFRVRLAENSRLIFTPSFL